MVGMNYLLIGKFIYFLCMPQILICPHLGWEKVQRPLTLLLAIQMLYFRIQNQLFLILILMKKFSLILVQKFYSKRARETSVSKEFGLCGDSRP